MRNYGLHHYGAGTSDGCLVPYRFESEADAKRWARWSTMLGDARSSVEVVTEEEAMREVPEAFAEGVTWAPRTVMGAVKAWEPDFEGRD